MKRLLISTTALSVALGSVNPWPLMAQTVAEDGSIIAADGTILCLNTAENACDVNDFLDALTDPDAAAAEAAAQAEAEAAAAAAAAEAEAAAAAAAEAEAQAQAEAEAAAAAAAEAEAAAQAEAEAAAQAAAEAAAQAEAEAAAAAAAEAEAQAAAEAQAQAEAEAAAAAAAEAEAAAQAAAEAAAAAAAEAEAAAAAEAEAAAEEAAAEEAAPVEEAPADESMAEEPVVEEQPAEAATTEELPVEEAPAEDPSLGEALEGLLGGETTEEATTDAPADAPDAATTGEATAEPAAEGEAATTEAEAPVVEVQPIDTTDAVPEDQIATPTVTEEAVESVLNLMTAAPATEGVAPSDDAGETAETTDAPVDPVVPLAAAVAAAATGATTDAPEVQPQVTVQQVTEETARSSAEEFATTAAAPAPATTAAPTRVVRERKEDDGLSDLEKAGLVALGALAVGAIINANRNDRVVANTGDRVVVEQGNGDYVVYKDDDTLLRRPGSTVRTESFRDGSTRTTVERADGTQVVTIRDATGRVLRRATYDDRGREIVLIDDLVREERVIVSELPPARGRVISISGSEQDALLKARMAALDAEELGRSFSLRQIREIPEVRQLAATIDVNNITFDSGSSAVKASEAEELAALGRFITALIRENPREMFLVEGHTDAVGSAASNLALSDRRAESVALALTEYFGVPPENLVVQGYGESELRVNTQADERQNRRVAVRVVTPLLQTASR